MGFTDKLREQGYKPKASTDGIWEPYVGTYKVSWDVCRLEKDEKNGNIQYIQAEWNILETVAGDPKRESKYADFRKRFYIEDPVSGEKNLQEFLDSAFTFGVDVSTASDEAMLADFSKLIGKEGYIRAYAGKKFRKEGETYVEVPNADKVQKFSIQQAKVATKKQGKDSVPF